MHSGEQGDGALPEYGEGGPTHLFHVADSEATFVDLLGLGGRSKNRQSKTQRSQKFLSESCFWNAGCVFPEKQS